MMVGVDRRERPEALGEAHLLLLVEVLVAQQDHEVLVPGLLDSPEHFLRERPRRVHAADLGAQRRRKRDDLHPPNGSEKGPPNARRAFAITASGCWRLTSSRPRRRSAARAGRTPRAACPRAARRCANRHRARAARARSRTACPGPRRRKAALARSG